jgi:hypothetical protein
LKESVGYESLGSGWGTLRNGRQAIYSEACNVWETKFPASPRQLFNCPKLFNAGAGQGCGQNLEIVVAKRNDAPN